MSGIFDDMSRRANEVIDRAKFEADKLQRTTALQRELSDMRRKTDERKDEFSERALDLYRAGQIQSPTLADIARALDLLRVQLTAKEEELKYEQARNFAPAGSPSSSSGSSQPYSPSPQPTNVSSAQPSQPATRTCETCGFVMPLTAVFCPSCGRRNSA